MKKKIIAVLIVFFLIAVIAAGLFVSSYIKKYTPSEERADLAELFRTEEPDRVLILLNYAKTDETALLSDGHLYLDYRFVYDTLNGRFYWDENEQLLLYTTASELIQITPGASSYTVGDVTEDFGSSIAKLSGDTLWIDIDFANRYSNFSYAYYDSPARLVMHDQWGSIRVVSAEKDTVIRQKGGIKSPILCDLAAGDCVTVISEEENWTKVMTDDGISGYVQKKYLGGQTTKTLTHEFEEEVFSHNLRDYKICMGWHQVFSREANADIADVLERSKTINVISPTWFYLNDSEGNLSDIASADYVEYCHGRGVEVWALYSNLENPDADTAYVLTHSSVRRHLVEEMISKALQYGLDGINLDFEAMSSSAVGEAYIQFVRELSIKCEENNLVLSVDNYVPSDYTAFYRRDEQADYADYVVIMGYDEHYYGSDAGSVASIEWVREGVGNTLKEVPSEQVILGMPFYTRVWCLTPTSGDSDTEMHYDVTSEAYGMNKAEKLVKANNAEKKWLEGSGQYFVEFEKAGQVYRIWMEDATSVAGRLKLLEEYSLAGASFWKLGLETSDVWEVIDAAY